MRKAANVGFHIHTNMHITHAHHHHKNEKKYFKRRENHYQINHSRVDGAKNMY